MIKSILSTTALALSLVLVTGCGETASTDPKTTEDVLTEEARLNAWFEAWFEREISQSPNFQSFLGINAGLQTTWSDPSDAYAAQELEETKSDLAEIKSQFDRSKLGEQAALSYDLFVYSAEREIDDAKFRKQNTVADQFRGQYARPLTILQNNHPIRTIEQAQAYIARVTALKGWTEDMVARLQDRADFGHIVPDFAFAPMINTVAGFTTGAPFDKSGKDHPLWRDFAKKLAESDIDPGEHEALTAALQAALTGPFKEGYEDLLAEIQRLASLQDKAEGVWSLPDGKAFYENRIKTHTTLDLTADEIHQIGLDDVARLHAEMRKIMQEVAFEGTLQDFFAFIRTDPNNFHENSDAGREEFLADARARTAEIFEVADQYFSRLPKAALEVRRVEPWREQSTSIAFYNRPSQDGTRPGIYYANLADMTGVQK